MKHIPRFHVLSQRTLLPLATLIDLLEPLAAAGVEAFHLREKDLPGGILLDLAQQCRQRLGGRAALFVNERVDVALLSQADGVQLPEQGIPVVAARQLLGPHMLIGRSVHDVAGARQAEEAGADFLLFGNVYETTSKPGVTGRGLAALRAVVAACHLPVIAIGGITPERVPEVLKAGAWGIAVISGVLAASDPVVAAQRYHQMLSEGSGRAA